MQKRDKGWNLRICKNSRGFDEINRERTKTLSFGCKKPES